MQNQPGQGVVGKLLRNFDIKELLHIVEGKESIDDKTAIPQALDPARCMEVVFILDLPDQFFEQILDSNQTAELPVFIDDQGPDGPDEQEALEALAKLVADKFYED